MRYTTTLLAAALAVACSPGSEPAVQDEPALQASAALLERAEISDEHARATALERAGGGTLTEAELEEEDGVLVFSYDIRRADGTKIGIEVNAKTGEIHDVDGDDEDDHEDDDDDEHGDDDDDEGHRE